MSIRLQVLLIETISALARAEAGNDDRRYAYTVARLLRVYGLRVVVLVP